MAPSKSVKPQPSALSVALESESLPALYDAWLALRLAHAEQRASLDRERVQLAHKADYLLKTVQAARDLPQGAPPRVDQRGRKQKALAPVDPLAAFHAEARAELAAAEKALAARTSAQARVSKALEARVRKALQQRADAHLRIHKPRLAITAHPVGAAQVMLEVARFDDEDAVLLTRLLHGRLPTRWGFFADDATDDLSRGPARFYADEGLVELYPPDADAEDAILFGPGDFLPLRGQLAFAVPDRPWPRFRLVHHGPIAQVEGRRAGEPYAHVLRREDGELLTGYLLRLKLAGRLELQLTVG